MKKMYKIKLTKVRAKPIIDKIAKEIWYWVVRLKASGLIKAVKESERGIKSMLLRKMA
jgi:hypothetical protein